MKYVNYVLIIIYVIISSLKKILGLPKTSNKKMLIILDQPGIGDTVCLLDALYNIERNFSEEFQIYFTAPKSVIHFLMSTNSTFGFEFISLDLVDKFKLNKFKSNSQILQVQKWDVIISFNRIGIFLKLLIFSLQYNKLYVSEFLEVANHVIERFLSKFLSNYSCLKFPYREHVLTVHKKMFYFVFNSLHPNRTNPHYLKYNIPILSPPILEKNENYILLCPSIARDHSNPFRAWSVDNYVKLCDYLTSTLNLKVCVSGTSADCSVNSYLKRQVLNKSMVIDLTGGTSFKEWIELIRNAKFIVGNDSGYIHLAAHLGVPSFVISGYWNYGRFLPYPNDHNKKTKPVDIRIKKVSCESCSRRFIPQNNLDKKECDNDIKLYNTYKCIHDISCEYVIQTIEKFYHTKENWNDIKV